MAPSRKIALLIGVENYDDGRFCRLPSCRADVWQLKQVLDHPAVGSFDSVAVLCDPAASDMRHAIAAFVDDAGPDDLLLLYLSGHGSRLVASTGEFHFVARDTDFDRVGDTAVSAGFVNEQLEACRARQKVTIIDACESGGFAVGLRTRDAKGARPALLQSRGVYVVSSSGAGEASYAGPVTAAGEPTPSVFTGEVIDALRSGKADGDGDGKVSIEDLFHYVSGRLRSRERDSLQVPVYSSFGVTTKIVIAQVIAGGAVRLSATPAELSDDRGTPPAGRPGGSAPPPPRTRAEAWWRLLDYYRRCVEAENLDAPLFGLGEEGDRFVYLHGRERVLSGGQDGDDRIEVPRQAMAWLDRTAQSEGELWAGYPAVLLYGSRDQPREARFAPLLMRRVEVVQDGSGLYLEPLGPAQPHPGLADEWLDEDQAAHLLATYYASWHAGGYAQMVKDIRAVLETEFELPIVEELRPEFLAEKLDHRTPTNGARNVAVLFRVTRKDEMVGNLLRDLARIAEHPDRIDHTALASLLPPPTASPPTAPAATPPVLVTPLACNEAQRAVIASAMTARLTVATGPPGTGKSQLVTNAVATAVSRGNTVLVASTNNTAVDEVWKRCQNLAPGMLVRTGNASYTEEETRQLAKLLALDPPTTNLATVDAALTSATRRWQDVRAELREVAQVDRDLLQAARRREDLAAQLSWTTAKLAAHLGDDEQAARWHRRAERCGRARLFARWRRQRMLRALGHPGEPVATTCRTVAEAAAAQRSWIALRRRHARLQADTILADQALQAEHDLRERSTAVVDAAVRTAAHTGRSWIASLRDAKLRRAEESGQRRDWPDVRRALSAVRGWAVSSLSARRFPSDPALFDLVIIDEASQCSIPQVLPLLYRARRALVIGDPMQLPHISTITPAREADAHRAAGLTADWLDERQLAYRRYSAFHAPRHTAGGSLLLDEHYRCHPDIANLVNELFYGGQLTVLTDTRAQYRIDRDPVVWVPVAGRPARPRHGRSWVNELEAEKVDACVGFLLRELPTGATVGVVTPYRAQADRFNRRWRHEPRVRAGTVHTFQGGECDAIVFGLVAGSGMREGSVAWLEAQRNLWNVAVSRARAHLVIVGDDTYWAAQRSVGADLVAAVNGTVGQQPGGDVLTQRLYERLSQRHGSTVELATPINGHLADATVRRDGTSTAVLLDRAAPAATDDPARHLRLQYQKAALLHDPKGARNVVRLPAWTLYDDERELLP
ncbi:MAG: caspase, EACC1-associated type [Mycobacteriales bacterium]